MVTRKAINTCVDGTCRTIVAWYSKGGRSNFCAWNGPGRFLMTGVMEIENTGPEKREIWKFTGYGTKDEREGGHYVKYLSGEGKVSPTVTTIPATGLSVIEFYDE